MADHDEAVGASAPHHAHADTLDIRSCPVCGRRNPADARFCGGCGQGLGEGEEPRQENVADPLVGRVIADRYRIVELLGRGGMGVVYKVEHIHIGKLMAMKLLHGELARDRNTVRRFQREAEAASRLSHPNTVQVFDFGRSEGLMYLVMEYLEGRDLGELVREEGHLEFERVARIGAQICASIAEAHENGVVHRDLKPENVMIIKTADGREIAKVLDFGLAKLRDHTGNMSVTRAGAIVGTPYYMPPEQIRGEQVDARGDLYAVGALLYKAATGVPPYVAKTPMGVLTKHLTEELVLPSRRSGFHLPGEADAIIGRAMEKDREKRHQSADELREDLLGYLESVGSLVSDPSMSRPSTRPVATAGGAATRADVDGYERRLRARGILGYFLLAALVAGLAVAGFFAWKKYDAREVVPTAESEPNDLPENADELPAEVELTGKLGERQSTELGDVDLYRIENPGGQRRLLDLHVNGLPNIDMIVDVVRDGHSDPVLSADSAGIGGDEHIRGFPLTDSAYIVRVRERWIAGQLPTENVSDEYSIRFELREQVEGEESEVNESLELANELAVGGTITGRIGWGGDVDTYCFPEAVEESHVRLSGVGSLDLRLRTVDRVLQRSRIFDEAGIGAPEQAPITAGQGRCVEVSVDPEEERGARSDPENTYELRHVAAPLPTVAEEEAEG
ncbi:MAG: serine/threonine protein kinase [Deltaproteobacteria bacterium]|nr:serine/threonine protein kinase [Deltaproteobacteria bacterium]